MIAADATQHRQSNSARRVFDLLRDRHASIERTVVVVAHPDDEVIGVGGILPRLKTATFIYTTDGAPHDMKDAERAGFTDRDAYRDARQHELLNAFAVAGINRPRVFRLPFTDKESSLNLSALTFELARRLKTCRPAIIFTHAYEGGHPDHDAAAFAVHHAFRLLAYERADDAPAHVEFTSYHDHKGAIRRGSFLNFAQLDDELTLVLSPTARALKSQMFRSFTSQSSVLAEFPTDRERFRIAPQYDFAAPPHTGRLHYETFDWGWTGECWRALARRAVAELRDVSRIAQL